MDTGKKRRWLHVPSPAMIVACVALFIAMGGTSYAAVTLAANSVGTKQIKKNAVTSAKIKSAAVTAAKVKDGTLTGAKIKDATLTGAKVQDATLTGAKLADGAVTEAKLADGAVAPTKMGTIPGARVRRTAALTVSPRRSAWRLVRHDRLQRRRRVRRCPAHPHDGAGGGQVPDRRDASLGVQRAGRRTLALEVNGSAAARSRAATSPPTGRPGCIHSRADGAGRLQAERRRLRRGLGLPGQRW